LPGGGVGGAVRGGTVRPTKDRLEFTAPRKNK